MAQQPWDELIPLPGRTRAPGVDDGDLERAESVLGWSLPSDLRDLYLATDGLRDDDAQLQVVWSLEELVALSRSAWCADLAAEGLVAFGTDGAGTSFCLRRDGGPRVRPGTRSTARPIPSPPPSPTSGPRAPWATGSGRRGEQVAADRSTARRGTSYGCCARFLDLAAVVVGDGVDERPGCRPSSAFDPRR